MKRITSDSIVARVVSLALVLLYSSFAMAAGDEPGIVVSTPTPKVYAGDQVIIDVEVTAIDDDINFDVLFDTLTLNRQTHGTRIAVVEGKVVEIRIWRFEATANTIGHYSLGPLRTATVTSNSIDISVEATPDVRWSPTAQDISLVVEWSKSRVYVQEQLLLTIRVDHLYPINKFELIEPEFAGFRVIELIKERRTEQNTTAGRSFSYLKRYALFAQSSGATTVPEFRAKGQIIKSRLERAPFELSSPAKALNIAPAPSTREGDWWLPALEVKAFDQWERDQRWLAAGEQVRRSAIVEASGVSAEQLPEIKMADVRGLRISFIDSERETFVHDNGVRSRVTFNYMIRALSPIPVFLDPITVHWWNTRDDKAQTARILPGRIDIGTPDRDALLESVADHRRVVDRLAQWQSTLWLIALALAIIALILNWRDLRFLVLTLARHVKRGAMRRLVDARLRRASHGDDATFIAGLQRWQQSTYTHNGGDNSTLDRYLERIYSRHSAQNSDERVDAIQVARALTK